MSMLDIWYDGRCKTCQSPVIETQGKIKDYKNSCTNPDCPHYRWHECDDIEELDYYDHDCQDEILEQRYI